MSELLTPEIRRLLGDKLYEKRKEAALDLQRIINNITVTDKSPHDLQKIEQIIAFLTTEYAQSTNPAFKKGSLLALAAVASGLSSKTEQNPDYLNKSIVLSLINPILSCSLDGDARTRYFACEAMYNVIKITRKLALKYSFDALFDFIFKFYVDVDQHVRAGTNLLDNLLKEIFTESLSKVNVGPVIPLIRTRIYTLNTNARLLLLSWIELLFSLPNSNFPVYVSGLVDGLFVYLGDSSKDIRRKSELLLVKLVSLIKKDGSFQVDFQGIVEVIAATHKQYEDVISRKILYAVFDACLQKFEKLKNNEEMNETMNNSNCDDFLKILFSKLPQILVQVLTDVSLIDTSQPDNNLIQTYSKKCNNALIKMFETWKTPDPKICTQIEKTLLTINLQKSNQKLTKLSLKWLALVGNFNKNLKNYQNTSEMLRLVCELLLTHQKDDDMVNCTVNCLCAFNTNEELAQALVGHYESFPDERFYYVLRTFFELKNGENSKNAEFTAQNIINSENDDNEDQNFHDSAQNSTVHLFTSFIKATSFGPSNFSDSQKFQINCMLNRLLQTSPELKQIRETENKIDLLNIHKAWMDSKCLSGAFCVCLWAGEFDKCTEILAMYHESVNLTDDHVKELERIVDYIEGPCFVRFRIDLMENNGKKLIKCLYRLLAVLPQKSKQFLALKSRLVVSAQYRSHVGDD